MRNMHHEGSNSGRGLPDPLTAPALTRYRGYHRAWPLLVVMAVYASLSADAIAQPGVSADRAALVALYNATGGENWTRKTNWSSSVPVGEWSGVTTDGDGRVTRLNLNNRNLTGSIPPELGTMAHLTGLDLSLNNLTGSIPPELGALTNLSSLDLSGNNLTGSIPPELGALTNLERLTLFRNNLTGPLPSEFVNLVNLERLSIVRNNGLCAPADATFRAWLATVDSFQGTVCSADRAALVALYNATGGENWTRKTNWSSSVPVGEWSGVTTDGDGRVTRLNLNNRNLTGPIPPELGTMAHLTGLDLSLNNLTGSIPPELGALTNLSSLDLSGNNLTGSIPPELGALTNLERLVLFRNNLTGPLPSEFVNLVNLERLSIVRNNGLCAPADATFRAWLATVDSFQGTVCSADRAALVALYNATGGENWTRKTNWSSSVPVGEWSGVTTDGDGRVTRLNLNNRNLTGPLPPELGTMAHLESLVLNNNNLTGSIPPELGALTNLRILYLSGNNLTGPLPAEFVNLVNLERLDIFHNNGLCAPADATFRMWLATVESFRGAVCSADRAALVALYNATGGENWPFSANWNISTVGEWSGVTTDDDGRVTHLSLFHKNLTGPLPPELGTMAHLESLELNNNNLTGSIPPELGALTNLRILRLNHNNLTGSIPPELGALTNLQGLYLGYNNLTGSIPPELGALTNLEILYLFHNNLTGPLPPELGTMAHLESLSITHNNLTGSIPPELGALTNLFGLTLNNNNLTGSIPPELGALTNLSDLWLNNNNLTGPLPLSMTNLQLFQLNFHNNAGLCLPTSAEFQEWRATIYYFLGDTCAAGTESFSIPNLGGRSITSSGTEETVRVGYGRISAAAGSTTPSGIAIFQFRDSQGVLITEASVPATRLIQEGRIFAEVEGPVNTGLAIANPNDETAVISFYFTDTTGTNLGSGTFELGEHEQTARFLNQEPFNEALPDGSPVLGTFTFESSVPIAVIALRGFTNEADEFLMTTLPVAPLSPASKETVYIPHFAAGGGWVTQVILVNPTDSMITGTVGFLGQGDGPTAASPVILTLDDGSTGSDFDYSIPPRSSQRFTTSNPFGELNVGSVRAVPDSGNAAPSGLVIFSYAPSGKTLSGTGVPALPKGSAFRVYAEASGMPGQIGSISTGLAITNVGDTSNTVTLEVTHLDGSLAAAPETLTLPPSGQVARFLDQVFSLPDNFSGVLRVTSTADIAIVALRLRVNENGEIKVTTLAPSNEMEPPTSEDRFFAHFADSGGWSTQFILFSGSPGQTAAVMIRFTGQDGQPLELSVAPTAPTRSGPPR